MSMSYTNYVIYGWDLTDHIDYDKLEDWKWEDGEKYFCNHRRGYVQIFDGGANDNKVRLGYIIWTSEEYDYDGDAIFDLESWLHSTPEKEWGLIMAHLLAYGILDSDFDLDDLKLICFRELK